MINRLLPFTAFLLLAVSAVGAGVRPTPSVADIEAALNLHRGAGITQNLLIGGERYRATYVGAEQRPGGRYAIIVKLER